MTSYGQFFWLLRQALDFLFLPPIWISMAVAATSGLTAAYAQRRTLVYWRTRPLWLFIVYPVLYLAVLLVPVLGGIRFDKLFPNRTAEFWVHTIFFGSIALSAYWIYRMKGLRWVTFSLAFLAQVALLSAFFVAEMAASGSWI